jgi:hypothetical protein
MPAIIAAEKSGQAGLFCCDFKEKMGCNDFLFKSGG